jgi:hypothetical protein
LGDPDGMGIGVAADPRDPAVLQRIHDIRREVRLRDARPNDGRCGNVTAALTTEFGWPGRSGYLRLLDGTVSWVHCWNRLDDGTVVDATADQYQGLWLGNVVILEPGEPTTANYLSDPREWVLRFDPTSAQVTCTYGDDVRLLTADDLDHPWLSLARQSLRLVTGWD